MPAILLYITATLLLLAVVSFPYGYYVTLRFVACAVFLGSTAVSYDRGHKKIPWVYAAFAILFNPLIKIHLPREAWTLVDMAAGVVLFATAASIKR